VTGLDASLARVGPGPGGASSLLSTDVLSRQVESAFRRAGQEKGEQTTAPERESPSASWASTSPPPLTPTGRQQGQKAELKSVSDLDVHTGRRGGPG